MLVGHYALALSAKHLEPEISLGTLVFSAIFADLLWCILLVAGIEHVQFKPALGAANYFAASDMPISHSLATDLLWAALLAAYFLLRRRPRAACVTFAVVLSHWLLDWISHRPDMPLIPGGHSRAGLGLWRSVPAALIVEGGFWLFAIVLYARGARPRSRTGVFAYWMVIVLLTLAWYNNLAGPPPSAASLGLSSFVFFSLIVAWAYWIDTLRPWRAERAGANAIRAAKRI